MSSDKQELIRRFAVAIAGAHHISEYLRHEIPHDMIWRIAEVLADTEPPQPEPEPQPADERMRRALQVLREAQTYHHFEGGWDGGGVLLPAKANDGDWVEADIVKQLRKILEGTT